MSLDSFETVYRASVFYLLFLGNTCIVVLAETYVKLVRINKYAFSAGRRLF